jgi:hypothetical protein
MPGDTVNQPRRIFSRPRFTLLGRATFARTPFGLSALSRLALGSGALLLLWLAIAWAVQI